MILSPDLTGRIAADPDLMRDFEQLCAFGGRLAGTESERLAMDFVAERGAQASQVSCRSLPVSYGGWRALRAELRLGDGSSVACHPLVRSIATPPGGLTAEVVDIGRGTPEEFEAHRGEIAGRFVLVRHELMFAAGTIHRRRKYDMAREAGALGFLIAGPLPNSLVTGSSGREVGTPGIPAIGIAPETAARLARTARGFPRATLRLDTEEQQAETRTLLFDIPGREDEWVVLSAHVDGHDLSESAIDNASGVAAALAVVRALAAHVANWRRGLRLAFFSAEEWALTGSALYVAQLSEQERSRIALNVNLDSVAGGPRLAALTSGFAGVEPFLLSVADANGHDLRCVRPLMTNSDHANFALAGIPAFRMVAGYDDPAAPVRLVLTAADTRDKVPRAELSAAAQLAACLAAAACQADGQTADKWRAR
ncbi:M28 family peptidase [Bradyrhizobium sp. LHD-71]|uniref:M28 family peptidase n=1 Tax=Bradyrhizobium sp. LHD-71 TaxID=3072141 RepID=UPI00280F3BEC|nr:M28 family peptidase [Bradyrhizobium sp. LHD-71]MDQ8731872.1 M28 family peptidase [Bradyrhizobium sp. LHD-71]